MTIKNVRRQESESGVKPLRGRGSFGPAVTRYIQYDAEVPADTPKAHLEDPKLWVHFAKTIRAGSEIRCVADDRSWVAYLYVTYSQGNDLRAKIVTYHKLLSSAEAEVDDNPYPGYQLKNGGGAGWYVKVESTGERLKLPRKSYPNPGEALKDLEEYIRALAA